MTPERDVDYSWRSLAESTRQALGLLGWDTPQCLPGEPQACGGSYAEHTAAHLAGLKALVEYRIQHLHLDQAGTRLLDTVYGNTLATLHATEPCEHEHGHGDRLVGEE